jgi:hypothetical protein
MVQRAYWREIPTELSLQRIDKIYLVPRRKLWVLGRYIESIGVVGREGARELLGSGSPEGTIKYGSATRIAVKPCACGAPLRG